MKCRLCKALGRFFWRRPHPGLYLGKISEFRQILRNIRCVEDRPADFHHIGNAIVFHGYSVHGGYFERIRYLLVANGFHVFLPDFPNHGLSVQKENERGFIRDFCDFVTIPLAIFCERILWSREGLRKYPTFIVCHSIGVIATLLFIQQHPRLKKMIAGIICIGTPFRVDHALQKHLRIFVKPILLAIDPGLKGHDWWDRIELAAHPERLNENGYLFGGSQDRLRYAGSLYLRVGAELENAVRTARRNIAQLEGLPILAVHGMADPLAPHGLAEEIFAKIPGNQIEFLSYQGGHDTLLLQDPISEETESVVAQIGQWMFRRTDEWNQKQAQSSVNARWRKVILPWKRQK